MQTRILVQCLTLMVGCLLACAIDSGHQEPKPEVAARTEPYSRENLRCFGRMVTAVDDCDGDGLRDYATGLSCVDGERGALRFFSGKTSEALFEVHGYNELDRLGSSAIGRLADLDGDLVSDLVVAQGPHDRPAVVISVGKRTRLFRIGAPAHRLIVCRTLDEDGIRDLLCCEGGAVTAFSGRDGEAICSPVLDPLAGMFPVHIREGKEPEHVLGLIAGPEGRADLYDCVESLDRPSRVLKFGSQASGLLELSNTYVKETALCMADMDLDGDLDLVQFERVDVSTGDTVDFILRITAFGSAQRSQLFTRSWESDMDSPPCLANCIALAGDLDGDGSPDVIVSNPSNFFRPGGVYAVSGRDGHVIWQIPREKTLWTCIGVSVDVIDDVDGDGAEDAIVGCGGYSYDTMNDSGGELILLSGRTGKELRRVDEESVTLKLQ